jgi:hypothetical protein
MADREQSQTSKRGVDEKPQRDLAGKGHPTSGSKGEERQHGVRNLGSVGRDEPDLSKDKEHGNRGRGRPQGAGAPRRQALTALFAVESPALGGALFNSPARSLS